MKSEQFVQYRERLDRMLILLTDKYHLPTMSGAERQISWANDIRIKFVDKFDKHKAQYSAELCAAVDAQILTHSEARWWIDRKDSSFEELILFAKTTARIQDYQEQKPEPRIQALPDVVLIDCRDAARICVSYPHMDKISVILQKFSFSDGVREISQTDNSREGMVESLCLSLLRAGFTARVFNPSKPEPVHDGMLRLVDGKLCIEARTEHVFKAAGRLGVRRVFVDSADESELRALLKGYDIGIAEDLKERFCNDE